MFTEPEATSACQDGQLCAGPKAGIDGAVHEVQAIWGIKLTTKDWGFILVYAKKLSTISIKSECYGQFVIYGHP